MSNADGPYLGLVPYSDADRDAARFFGREEEIELIASNLRAARLTVLYGQSGVGKTSLLRAGVLHSMRALEVRRRDRGRPPQGCVAYFAEWAQAAPAELAAAIRAGAAAALGGDATGLPAGDDLVALIAAAAELTGGPVRLILDQFEEYFRYPEAAARTEPALLTLLGDDTLSLQVLISLREDALHLLDHFKARGLAGLFDNRLALGHLDRAGARLAIEAPVRDWYNREVAPQAPVTLEPELVEAVLDQLAALGGGAAAEGVGSGANATFQAPYLQLVMERLWQEGLPADTGARTLAAAALDRLGGVKGIVDSHVDTVMLGLRPGLHPVAAEMFDRLVTPSFMKVALSAGDLLTALEDRDSLAEELAAAGENAAPERLPGLLDEVLAFLGGASRVLRSFEDRQGAQRFELYHDALGQPIRAWLGRYERDRRERAAAEEAQQQQLRVQALERLNRRTRFWLWVASGLLVLAVGLGVYGYDRARDAEAKSSELRTKTVALEQSVAEARDKSVKLERAVDEAREATARTQVAQREGFGYLATIQASLVKDERQRLLLAAYAQTTNPNAQASLALSQSLARLLSRRFVSDDLVTALAFSPDGTGIMIGSLDGTARVLDIASMRERARFARDGVLAVLAFSPDGTRLAARREDDTARVWDIASGRERAFFAYGGPFWALAFNHDGTRVVTGSADKIARVWDVASERELARFKHDDLFWAVAFSADGTRVVTGSADRAARVWDVASERELARFKHDGPVWAVAFSADGTRIVTGSADKTARVWDVASERELARLRHGDLVRAVAFSADGTRIVTGSADKTARVWDAASGREIERFEYDDPVEALAISSDGTRLALAVGKEAVIRYWRPQELVAQACSRVDRNLSRREWRQFLGDAEYVRVCPGLPVPEE